MILAPADAAAYEMQAGPIGVPDCQDSVIEPDSHHDALVPLEQAPAAPHDWIGQPIGDTVGPIHLFLDMTHKERTYSVASSNRRQLDEQAGNQPFGPDIPVCTREHRVRSGRQRQLDRACTITQPAPSVPNTTGPTLDGTSTNAWSH
jgi:hypothetical protein